MQSAATQIRPAVGVVLDSDLGASIDDVLALALLFGLEGKSESRLVAISVSYPNLMAAAFADSIAKFYTGPFSRLLPIGLAGPSPNAAETPMMKAVLSRQSENGEPLYPNSIRSVNDTAEPSAMLRNALTAQHDGNAIVLCLGPATSLAALLDLRGARELIERKVRYLVLMGGAYPSSPEPEHNIKSDIAAAKKVLSQWPTPVVASGFEVGTAVRFPGESIEKDFGWTDAHPVVDAYRAFQQMPYDAPSWDLTAALYAVRPQEKYFGLSEPGTIVVEEDGRTVFTPTTGGKHRHLIADLSQKDRITTAWTELVSAKPVRPQRRLPAQQQQQKPAPPPKSSGSNQQ